MLATSRPDNGKFVLTNAVVHRLPGDPEPATALAIDGGVIVAVGSTDDARAALRGARVVDLRGRAVLPAFVDSHTHFHRASVLRELYLDFEALAPADIADVLVHVGERAGTTPPGGWIQGDSISAARLSERRLPDRTELDPVSGDHPLIIRGIGKHVVAANTAALLAAGIDRHTEDPPGGRIERDDRGEPTGILHERAKLRLDASAVDTVVPKAEMGQRLQAVRKGIDRMHELGVSTIHEMVRQPEEAADLAALHSQGDLGLRVRLFYRIHESPLSLDWLLDLGLRSGWGDDWLRVGGVKISVDGWCIFRNAAVYEPYAGDDDNTGLLRIEPEVLDDLVARADRAGLRVAVHAVGARAVDAALDAFEAAQPAGVAPHPERRHRIEHAHLDVSAKQLQRLRSLSLVLSAQPSFLHAYRADWETALAADRIDRIMPIGSAHRLGIPVIINSDVPSGPVGPLQAIAAAVAPRGTSDVEGGGENLSMVHAWRAHSSTAATLNDESALGVLEPGYRADLIVLEEDPFASRRVPATIGATIIDGRVVHDPGGWLT